QVHLTVHRLSHRRATGEEAQVRDDRSTRVTDTNEAPEPVSEPKLAPRSLLPGLMATHGGVDNEAGAELLRRRRETRGSQRGSTVAEKPPEPAQETPPEPTPPSEPEPAPAEEVADDDEELYDDLYLGPNYPVEADEEEDENR
ncbi:MAG: hypothetical protein PF961_02815, partial [Planctomycetota bacterium]|nr:hypothetical protein [Planctomycetota bacterium]